MTTPNRILAAAVALALSGAGIALALADAPPAATAPTPGAASVAAPAQDEGPVQVTETLSGVPSATQGEQMSANGLAAARAVGLARVALNDGYVDESKQILTEAQGLLEKVKQSDKPMTVATQIKVGDKSIRNDKATVTPDLIPIFSEVRIVEAYDQDPAKVDAVKKAREHLKKGEQKEAVAALRLAEVGLVTREVSMPLSETVASVDRALKLIDSGKLHEANLELKKVNDGLLETSDVLVEPDPAVASSDQGQAPAGSDKN